MLISKDFKSRKITREKKKEHYILIKYTLLIIVNKITARKYNYKYSCTWEATKIYEAKTDRIEGTNR